MKNNVIKNFDKLPANSLFVFIILVFVSLFGCNKNSESTIQNPIKEQITLENLGQVHNYLLAKYENSNLKSASTSKTFGDIYKEFEKILLNSDQYSMNSTISSTLSDSEKQLVLDKFSDIKLDANFQKEFEQRVLTYLQSFNNIDEILKSQILNAVENYSLIDNSTNMKGDVGYDLVLAYNNVYESSMAYWSKKGNLKSVNVEDISENKAIIWADATGALIGLGCGGVMSILMGAAASNAIVECYEM